MLACIGRLEYGPLAMMSCTVQSTHILDRGAPRSLTDSVHDKMCCEALRKPAIYYTSTADHR